MTTELTIEDAQARIFKWMFSAWIGGGAALIFLPALSLAVAREIGWMQLADLYAAIGGVTLSLAALVYLSSSEE